MNTFRVWAPNAKKAELVLSERRVKMSSTGGGWFAADARTSRNGTDYRFSLDGSEPLPDPRSPWQPEGVHGASRTVDHSAFKWTDGDFRSGPLGAAIMYELHVGTFSPEGTFDGVIAYLDHLVNLGVTHVELLPVCEFAGPRGWGYDGVDIYAPHHAYGGPDGLKRLVNACHRKNLAVMLDVVYNHFGPEGCYVEKFGPYFSQRYSALWGKALNYDDAGSDEVRRFIIDNALMWLRNYHVDGLRLDSIMSIMDLSPVHVLAEMAAEVRNLQGETGRHQFLIGESSLNDPRVLQPAVVRGLDLDAQWADDLHHALHSYLTGEHVGYYADYGLLAQIAKALSDPFVFEGQFSKAGGKRWGTPVGDMPGWRFVAYMQTHDQVGNRATAERITHLAGEAAGKIAAALIMTSPYVPLIFQGEEWAASSPFQYFSSMEDKKLGQAIREGRKKEFAHFGWKPEDVPDPQDEATFKRSKLKWSEITSEPHASTLQWFKSLIHLRRTRRELANNDRRSVQTFFDEKARWLVVQRGPTTVACNFSKEVQLVPVAAGRPTNVLLASGVHEIVKSKGVSLAGQSVVIMG